MSFLKPIPINSKQKTFVLVVCVFLSLISGFGFENLTAAAAAQKTQNPAGTEQAEVKAQTEESFSRVLEIWEKQGKEYVFVPADKHDPFFPVVLPEGPKIAKAKPGKPLTPLQTMELSSIKLVAIISSGNDARALVEDSTGMGYIVKVGTYIGTNNGRVQGIFPASVEIRDGVREIVKPGRIEVKEQYRTYLGKTKTRVVTIPLKGEEK